MRKIYNFFYNYRASFLLLLILFLLIRYVFFTKNFSNILSEKKQKISAIAAVNDTLKKENQDLFIKLKAISNTNMEILESEARYRFGFIKKDERYYQINQTKP